MPTPTDAVIATTFRCNARCLMCNVWRDTRPDALRPEHMDKLPQSLRTVNLSGGEPFLRDDLPEFVRRVRRRCPRARITISTNGYVPARIDGMMAEIRAVDPDVRLAVSLDGIGAAHDRVRGIPGAFDAAVGTLDVLSGEGYGGLRLSMTLSPANLDELERVADFADQRGLELGVVAAHAAGTHLGVGAAEPAVPDRAAFERVVSRWLRSPRPKQWLRAHFLAGTYRKLLGRPWRTRRAAGREFFFVQADGMVHSCSVQGRAMGNLAESDWETLWYSPEARRARRAAERCGQRCWMICTARATYRTRWPGVLAWVALHKPLAHLGLPCLPATPEVRARPEPPCADTAR